MEAEGLSNALALSPLLAIRSGTPLGAHRHGIDLNHRHQRVAVRPARIRRRNPLRKLPVQSTDKAFHLGLHRLHLFTHVEDDLDAGQVHAEVPREMQDYLEPLQVIFGVEPCVAFAAGRSKKPLPFVEPQCLRVDLVLLGHGRDHVSRFASVSRHCVTRPFEDAPLCRWFHLGPDIGPHILRLHLRQFAQQLARPLILNIGALDAYLDNLVAPRALAGIEDALFP